MSISDIMNTPLIQNLEQGELPVVHVEVELSKNTIFEITLCLLIVVTFAVILNARASRK